MGWRDGENTDPNGLGNVPTDSSLITAPAGIGSGDNMIDVSTTQVPVWVLGIFDLNHGVQVKSSTHQYSVLASTIADGGRMK